MDHERDVIEDTLNDGAGDSVTAHRAREAGPTAAPATDHEVIVVGAGPVGLWLAHELRLAGVSVLVLERDARRSPFSKALGVHPRTVEVLAMRGRHKQLLADGFPVPDWHFGMLEARLDFRPLDTPYPFMLAVPQLRTEALMEQYGAELGVEIRRGHAVTSLGQDDRAVTVGVSGSDGDHELTARYVVGCDGAGSTVRRLSGIAFPGTDASHFGFLGEVTLDSPPQGGPFGRTSPEGNIMVVSVPGGLYRVTGYDRARQRDDGPLTQDELRDTTVRLAGTDFGMRDPVWLSRFGNATRLAETYRDRRVFLAGDAAHMHFPAGGVGLNVGVQDAMNLGWKLAAEVQGRATPGLLDTYHSERHPVGADLVEHTLAQTALVAGLSPEGMALRAVLSDAIRTHPDLSLRLARRLAALDVTYAPTDPAAHPLVGSRRPAAAVTGDFLHGGRAVLFTLPGTALDPSVERQAARLGVEVHGVRVDSDEDARWSKVAAALIRPDGHVWWATEHAAPQGDVSAEALGALAALPATF